jgi:TRAP-type uncharacterized transport system substrate-binding protein
VTADTPTIGEPVVIVARADMDEALVYKITKTLFDSRADVVAVQQSMQSFTPAFASATPVIPIHPGALRFYKEAGVAK